ncbi:MAG: OmpA family protein [Desulfomonilaceae bacterium]
MSDKPTSSEPSEVKNPKESFPEDDSLVELRRLILGTMESDLAQLQLRLDDPDLRANELSRVLPEAIVKRSTRDDSLVTALTPTVEKSVRFSIKGNLKAFADALFPVMGPAIRKAISEALRTMMESLNQALDKSFSMQGIKWRLKALRSRKPFSEIVLLHSIVYRVEQVFLIDKKTGLMLQHVVRAETDLQDADMVSSMLTAIRDFVADSFKVEEDEGLETIRVGELTVWIEQGPLAILAVVIRGNAPQNLRLLIQETLENIHLTYAGSLESFDGDTTPFEEARPALEECLVSQYKQERKKLSPALLSSVGVVILALIIWIGLSIHDHLRWLDLLARLNSEKGIVITQIDKQNGRYIVRGLRDELAVDPSILLKQAQMKPDQVSFQWTPYQAMNDQFVIKRAEQILRPPDTVSLKMKKGKMVAEGSASHDWIAGAHRLARAIPGIETFNTDGLIESDLEEIKAFNDYVESLKREKGIVVTSAEKRNGEYHVSGFLDPLAANPAELLNASMIPASKVVFHWEPYQSLDPFLIAKRAKKMLDPPRTVLMRVEDGCIVVSGSASHQWIAESRRRAGLITGACCLIEKDLVDVDLEALQAVKREIEKQNILFLADTPNLVPNQSENIDQATKEIRKAVDLANRLGIPIQIKVLGHTDEIDSEGRNKRLSQLRAERVIDLLLSSGISPGQVSAHGLGASQSITPGYDEHHLKMNRRVSFQVVLGQGLI